MQNNANALLILVIPLGCIYGKSLFTYCTVFIPEIETLKQESKNRFQIQLIKLGLAWLLLLPVISSVIHWADQLISLSLNSLNHQLNVRCSL